MSDTVARLDIRADDNVSAAANAAAAALTKAAQAADGVDASVTKATKSAAAWQRQLDPVTSATSALQKAMATAEAAQKAFSAALETGAGDADSFGRAMATADAKVQSARARLAEAKATATDLTGAVGENSKSLADNTTKIGGVGDAHKAAAGHAGEFSLATAGATRELLVLGHEALTGNWSRIPGSLMVMAERTGGLHTVMESLGGVVMSTTGLFIGLGVGAVAALAMMTVSGNNHLGMLNATSQALRGTRADYEAMGATVLDVAQKVSHSSGLGLDEALATAKELAAGRYFAGTSGDLERLTRDAADLAAVMGGTAADGAKTLAEAMDDPAKAAEKLAPVFAQTLTPELQRQIELAQKAGDQNKAFALLLNALESSASGAARNALSPLRQAWQDLGNAFTGGTSGWSPFNDWLAGTFAGTLETIANAIKAVGDAWRSIPNFSSMFGDTASGGTPIIAMPGSTSSSAAPSTAQLTANSTKDAFISAWTDAAKQAGSTLGVDYTTLLGQWGLETGWGQHTYNFNAGNIKAGSNYAGSTYVNPGDGQTYRAYSSMQEFATDFASVMQSGRYSSALNTGSNATAYAQALQSGGYATDPNYASKLTSAASSVSSVVSGAMVDNSRSLADNLQKATDATREMTGQSLQAELERVNKAMQTEADSAGTDTAKYKALTQEHNDLTAKIYLNVDAMTQAQRAAESQLRANDGLTQGEIGLAAAIEARRQVKMNSTGADLSANDVAEATNEYLAKQSQQYLQLSSSISRSTGDTNTLAAAWLEGDQAAAKVTASQKAYSAAIQLFPRDSGLAKDAAAVLTQEYVNQAIAANSVQIAQQTLRNNQSTDYIQAETATLGMNNDARDQLLARIKAEQVLKTNGISIESQLGQAYLNSVANLTQSTNAYKLEQSSLSELSGFFTNTFDTISNSITSAFANGTLESLKLKSVAMSVASAIASEFLKLSALNPLKNLLFGTSDVTISSVGGVLGSLFGLSSGSTTASTVATTGASTASGVANLVSGSSGSSATSSGVSALSGAGAVATGGSALANWLGLKDVFKDSTVTGLDSLGSYIVGQVTSLIGNTAEATNAALAASGSGVYGVATASQVAGASVGQALGLSDGAVQALSSAAGTVAQAIPYIGAAISVVTSLVSGDYKTAAFTAGGAALGTIIAPGIGTAIGAIAGNLLSSFIGNNHPLHSYEDVSVDLQGGQIVAGKQVSQVESSSSAASSVNQYGQELNAFLKQVGVVITNADVTLGHLGNGITGLTQHTDINDFFSALYFGNSASDTSTFGVAKGALSGMHFSSETDLANELSKIAGFADAVDAVGIQLKSVGTDLSNIQISGVTGAGTSDLRTALNNDLPRQAYANVDALNAEIDKVNTFVNSTVPGLLNPVESTTSSIVQAVQKVQDQYNSALAQAQSYGLDYTQALTDAEQKAIAIVRKSGVESIANTTTQNDNAYLTTVYPNNPLATYKKTLDDFDQSAKSTEDAFSKLWTDTYGDGVKQTADYLNAINGLEAELGAERVATVKSALQAIQDAYDSLAGTITGFQERYFAANGDQQTADLLTYDAKASAERTAFVKQATDFYGDQILSSTVFQSELALVDQVHYQERLAIVQKYSDQSVAAEKAAAQQTLTYRNTVAGTITSLTSYAHGLQTSAASPLSTQDQYALASGQFNAVSGAARAGNYTSVSQVQSYADAFLTASRTLNGSGVAYVADFNRVLDALDSIAQTNDDALTGSYMQSIAQQQTDQLVTELQALRSEVSALRVQVAQGSNAPARVAA